jgi:16S rRNA (guanine966-N2)-methyltransferase
VRPTTDRVREAAFSILFDATRGATVLDLFAGSGALGLEALSRGASRAVFVEHSKTAAAILRQNVEACGFVGRSKLLCSDALRALRSFAQSERFNLAFLDPPYDTPLVEQSLAVLVELQLLLPEAVVVAEQRIATPLPSSAGLRLFDERRYGDTVLRFFTNS